MKRELEELLSDIQDSLSEPMLMILEHCNYDIDMGIFTK